MAELTVQAPMFDNIRRETGDYTTDGFQNLWLQITNEITERVKGVTEAKNRLEPKVFVLSASGAINDLDIKGSSIVHSTGGTSFNLSGFVAPSTGKARMVIFYNSGTGTVTLKHQATSVAANQLTLLSGADTTKTTNSAAGFVYLASKWRQVF